jgi:hypothetical protein
VDDPRTPLMIQNWYQIRLLLKGLSSCVKILLYNVGQATFFIEPIDNDIQVYVDEKKLLFEGI